MQIRKETPADHVPVWEVEYAAFERKAEADLVDALRASGQLTLSLVAELDQKIVGHVAFSDVWIEPQGDPLKLAGLGPLAVHPLHQRTGAGGKLVQTGLKICEQMGYAAVFLLGSPKYYTRFGFQPAYRWDLACQFPAPPEAFMAIELISGALSGLQGTVYYQPVFATVE